MVSSAFWLKEVAPCEVVVVLPDLLARLRLGHHFLVPHVSEVREELEDQGLTMKGCWRARGFADEAQVGARCQKGPQFPLT